MNQNFAYVIGATTPDQVYVVSQVRPFVASEYLQIDDPFSGKVIGEIKATESFFSGNKEMLANKGITVDELACLGLNTGAIVHIGTLKILSELNTPICPMCPVSEAPLQMIEPLLGTLNNKEYLTIGTIKGTEHLQAKLPEELRNIAPLFRNGRIVPQAGVPFVFNHKMFQSYPGIGIFGGAGSGKSSALRVICEELQKLKIGGVILDPHNEFTFKDELEGVPSELRQDYSKRHVILTVGKDIGIRFEELKTQELLDLFSFYNCSPAMISSISAIHETGDTYGYFKEKVINLKKAFENERKAPHNREELGDTVEELFRKYKDKVSGLETMQAILWRLESLDATNIFTLNSNAITNGIIKEQMVVLRGSVRHLQMIMVYAVKRLYQARCHYKDWDGVGLEPQAIPKFLIIADEAHNFASNSKEESPTTSLLRKIAQEGRKYGVFEILATQRASLLNPTIVTMINTKLIFRNNNAADLETISKESGLSPREIQLLPDLPSGHCFISSATIPKQFHLTIRSAFTKAPKQLNPFDEQPLVEELNEVDDFILLFITNQSGQKIRNNQFVELQQQISACLGKFLDIRELIDSLDNLAVRGDLKKRELGMGVEYRKL